MPSFICCLHAAHVGNIQKAQPSAFRNSIKFLSLCSRLFLWNPIVMHWSWNQSPAVHAAISMISDSGVQKETRREREGIHNNAIDNPINKREGGDRKYPGPWSSTGWTGVAKLRPVGQVWTRDTRRVSGGKREERKGLKSQSLAAISTADSSKVLLQRFCACSEPWTALANNIYYSSLLRQQKRLSAHCWH